MSSFQYDAMPYFFCCKWADNRCQLFYWRRTFFALIWAGIKANYGVTSGKVAYQVKIVNLLSVAHLPFEEGDPHDLRIGWSSRDAGYTLGEAHHSYGYCSVGKKATRGDFVDWGVTFHKGDVITCCLDFDLRQISYYVNEEKLGVAFDKVQLRTRIKSEPDDEQSNKDDAGLIVYFPHIATKHCRFEANFGQQQNGWCPLPEGYIFLNNLPEEKLITGPQPLPEKSDCTVLMMVGLPEAGKTTWVRQYLKEHPDEQWTLISADAALYMMKVNGVPRRKVQVMGLIAKAITKPMQLACPKRKNYVIDQTNVSMQGRRIKLGPFKDFQRKVAVIVPSDHEFANHQRRQSKETEREMLELKALFAMPSAGTENYIDMVHFVEPSDDDKLGEAYELVARYNQEGKPWSKSYRRDAIEPVTVDLSTNVQSCISPSENSSSGGVASRPISSVPEQSNAGWPSSDTSMAWGRPGFFVRVNQGFAGIPTGQFSHSSPPEPAPECRTSTGMN